MQKTEKSTFSKVLVKLEAISYLIIVPVILFSIGYNIEEIKTNMDSMLLFLGFAGIASIITAVAGFFLEKYNTKYITLVETGADLSEETVNKAIQQALSLPVKNCYIFFIRWASAIALVSGPLYMLKKINGLAFVVMSTYLIVSAIMSAVYSYIICEKEINIFLSNPMLAGKLKNENNYKIKLVTKIVILNLSAILFCIAMISIYLYYLAVKDMSIATHVPNLIVVFLCTFAIAFTYSILFSDNLKSGLDSVLKNIENISNGDLASDEILHVGRNDEIGQLARMVKTMRHNLQHLVQRIATSANHLNKESENLFSNIEQSVKMAKEIEKNVGEIAKGANHQLKATEQGAKKVDQMGELIKKYQEFLQQLTVITDDVVMLKNEGFNTVKELIKKTETNNKTSEEIYDVITRTNESAMKISSASEMIRSIAEQTNLLSLNAAIEAARAGDAGRGFAVVADEIRKLAEQSNRFTKEIEDIIKDLTHKASVAVEKIQEISSLAALQTDGVAMTEKKFEGIAAAIENTKQIIGVLNESGHNMSNKTSDIISVIQNLSRIAEENDEETKEASSTVEEQTSFMKDISDFSKSLAQVSEEMKQSISTFKF